MKAEAINIVLKSNNGPGFDFVEIEDDKGRSMAFVGWSCDDGFYRIPIKPGHFAAQQPETYASQAMIDVIAMRIRQIEKHKFDRHHDDSYLGASLAVAAACFLFPPFWKLHKWAVPTVFPWPAAFWKFASPREACIKGISLALAYVESLDRKAANKR